MMTRMTGTGLAAALAVLACGALIAGAAGVARAAEEGLAEGSGTKEINSVAILIFDGVQIIDYTGPYEVFGQAGFDVFTVSETGETVTTNMGMSVNPTHSFESSPPVDILLIPGGAVKKQHENPHVIEWIREQSKHAENVLSVCNGAFILAKTGLLDGKSATTFYGLLDELERFAPAVRVVRDQRYVDNGKLLTSAGLSSGIDASLYLVSRIKGMGKAEAVALNMEYDWRPDSNYARGAFADRHMPDIDFPDGVRLQTASAKGDRDRFEAHYAVSGTLSAAEVLAHLNRELAEIGNWTRTGTAKTAGGEGTQWRFKDGEGGTWICETFLGPATKASGGPTLAYRLRRAGGTVDRPAMRAYM
jgi:putative intracellular protease/amidase